MSYDILTHIALMGDYKVGKSSLVRRYVHKSFQDKYIHSLIEFKAMKITLDDQNIKLGLWDISPPYEPSEENGSSGRFHLPRRKDAIVLVYDVTDKRTFEQLDSIFEGTKPHLPKAPEQFVGMVIGNKTDATEDCPDAVPTKDGLKWASDHEMLFCETSAKTGDGVTFAIEQLVREILRKRQNSSDAAQGFVDIQFQDAPQASSDKITGCCCAFYPTWLAKVIGAEGPK